MSLEEELGSRLREVIRAEQRAFPEPVDLEGRLIRAMGRARPGPRRPGIARELTLAAALLLMLIGFCAGAFGALAGVGG